MAIELNLDTVDQLAQDNYADIMIPLPGGEVATLVHPLRMEDERRQRLVDYFKEVQGEDGEDGDAGDVASAEPESEEEAAGMLEQLQGLLGIIVAGDADGLFTALGADLTRYQAVVTFYFETVNPGEA